MTEVKQTTRKLHGVAAMGAGPGRPKGVPNKATQDIKAAAAVFGPGAIKALSDIATSAKFPAASRVAAAVALLDRGFGKPTQAVQMSGSLDMKSIPDAELEARIAMLVAKGTA